MMYRNSWFPGANLIELGVIYIIIGISGLLFLLNFDFQKALSSPINLLSSDNKFFLIFFSFLTITIAVNNFIEITDGWYFRRLLCFISYFIIYFIYLPSLFLEHKDYFFKFLKFFSILGAYTSIFGIVIFFLGFKPISHYGGNFVSFCIHPNYISFFLTTSIISTLFLILYKKGLSKYLYYFLIATIFIQFFAQLLTLCRAGIMGSTVGILLLFVFYLRKKSFFVIPFVILLAQFVISNAFVAKGSDSTISRFLLLVPAYNMIVESTSSFLWGYGPSKTFDAYAQFRDFYFIAEKVNNPHNTVVSMIIMFGSLFTFVMLFFGARLLFKGSFRSFKSADNSERLIYGFLVTVLSGLFIQGLFDSAILMPEFFDMQFFLLFLGLLHRLTSKKFSSYNYSLST